MIFKHQLLLVFIACFPALVCGQTNITDVQEVNPQGSTDVSPFLGQTVAVRGIITASAEADNLGVLFVQQEGVDAWAGIRISSGDVPALLSLVVGNRVVIRGRVDEQNGRTELEDVVVDSVQGMGTIEPVVLDPAVFTNYSLAENEQYEGMLVRLAVDGQLIRVVNLNADGPFNNFGEWRVGTNPATADVGCRILTGRSTATVFSSLNVSYINDEVWATNSGTLQVDPVVVTTDSAFQSITGIVDYSSGEMKLLPRNNDDFVLRDGTVSARMGESIIQDSRLFPNPVTSSANLEFTLSEAGVLRIELYDVSGKFIRKLVGAQRYVPGTSVVPLPPLSSLPPGTYYVRVAGPNAALVLPMLKQ